MPIPNNLLLRISDLCDSLTVQLSKLNYPFDSSLVTHSSINLIIKDCLNLLLLLIRCQNGGFIENSPS